MGDHEGASGNTGFAQELRLVQHLRARGCQEITHGEEEVKRKLGLPLGPGCKSADVIAFEINNRVIGKIIVAESKGTEVSKAIKQLGNAAAAAMQRFPTVRGIELLLYRSELRKVEAGLSPGPGYLVKPGPSPKTFTLIDATTGGQAEARAQCDLPMPWSQFNAKLLGYQIHVFVEQL